MRIEKTLKLAPGGEFRLDTDMGKVTLVGSSQADVHVVVTSRRKDLDELMTFRWDGSPGLVSITAPKKRSSTFLRLGRQGAVRGPRSHADPRLGRHLGRRNHDSGLEGPVRADTSGGGMASPTSSATSRPTPRWRNRPSEHQGRRHGGHLGRRRRGCRDRWADPRRELRRLDRARALTGDIEADTRVAGSGSSRPAATSRPIPRAAGSRPASPAATRPAARSRPRAAASRC